MAASYWKYSSVVTLAASTVAAILDAVGNASATIRTEMEADGWAFELDGTDGVSMTPPNAPNQRCVIAGVDSGAPTPTMLGSDTFVTAMLFGGCCFQVTTGTFDWDNSTCGYTGSAEFSGYVRAIPSASQTRIQIIYNDHACVVWIWVAGTNDTKKVVWLGGWVDPTDPALVEADGKAWGISCSGGVATTGMHPYWWSANTANATALNCVFSHASTNGNAHTFVRKSGTFIGCTKTETMTIAESIFMQNDVYMPLPVVLFTNAAGGSIGVVDSAYKGDDYADQVVRTSQVGSVTTEAVMHVSGAVSTGISDSVAFLMIDPDTIDP